MRAMSRASLITRFTSTSRAIVPAVIAGSATQDYKAFADTNGQTHVDVTSQCAFKVADTAIGGFSGAHFASNPRGGDTTVTATCGTAQGTGNLHLLLKGWILATG